MTEDENILRFCHQSNLIEGIDDLSADRQMSVAYRWLMRQEMVTWGTILELHSVMLDGFEDRPDIWNGYPEPTGKFRDCDVWVGGRKCPDAKLIRSLTMSWCEKYGIGGGLTADECLKSHVEYEHVHPFIDGNGRTGRLLMAWVYLKNGNEPPLFRAKERYKKYYPLFA